MTKFRWGLVVTLLGVLSGCGGSGGDSGSQAGENSTSQTLGGEGSATHITFIHLNDLHAHLAPHADYVKTASGWTVAEAGGLARIATVIKQIRADNPNSVLMNIGDTFHGGVEALFTQGNAIAAPLNALGVDVGVPGNWDFAYGPAVTRARYTGTADSFPLAGTVERPNFPNLAANVTYTMPLRKKGENFLPPTWIKEMGGVKIGFIGITSDIVPRMHPILAAGLSFLTAESDYLALLQQQSAALKQQGVAMVVVMSELGIQKDWALARQLAPRVVDVFFSAHTHEASFTPQVATNGTWVMEAGDDIYLGRLDVTFENGVMGERQWQLITVDNKTAEDPAVKQRVDAARAPFLAANLHMTLSGPSGDLVLDTPIDTVVAQVSGGLDRRNSLSNGFNRTYAAMLSRYAGTQLGLTPGFRFDAVVANDALNYEDPAVVPGRVTVEDAYRFFPVQFGLATAQVSGARLKEVIEGNLTAVYSPAIFNQSGGWVDGFAGVDIKLNLAAPDGARVAQLIRHDTNGTVQESDSFTVAGCTRPWDDPDILCSYSGFSTVTPLINPATQAQWSSVEFLIYALKNNLHLGLTPGTVSDSNATPLWPAGDFYQPLAGVGGG